MTQIALGCNVNKIPVLTEGSSLAPADPLAPTWTFDFTTGFLPAGCTFTRPVSGGFGNPLVYGSDRKLYGIAPDTPRFQHRLYDGVRAGLILESAATQRMPNPLTAQGM